MNIKNKIRNLFLITLIPVAMLSCYPPGSTVTTVSASPTSSANIDANGNVIVPVNPGGFATVSPSVNSNGLILVSPTPLPNSSITPAPSATSLSNYNYPVVSATPTATAYNSNTSITGNSSSQGTIVQPTPTNTPVVITTNSPVSPTGI